MKPRITRSTTWPTIRDKHLADFPTCVVCGTAKRVEAHHIIPVHIDPTHELDPENLVTLCRRLTGGHHLSFGHLGNWKLQNPCVRAAALLNRTATLPTKP